MMRDRANEGDKGNSDERGHAAPLVVKCRVFLARVVKKLGQISVSRMLCGLEEGKSGG